MTAELGYSTLPVKDIARAKRAVMASCSAGEFEESGQGVHVRNTEAADRIAASAALPKCRLSISSDSRHVVSPRGACANWAGSVRSENEFPLRG